MKICLFVNKAWLICTSVFLLRSDDRIGTYRDVVTIVKTIGIVMWLLVCSCIIYVILILCWLKCLTISHYLRLAGDSFRIWVFAVRAHVHLLVCTTCSTSSVGTTSTSFLLFERWPSFLSDESIFILHLRSVLKERL